MTNNLFICYPSEHREFAKRLAWQLSFYGFKIWYDLNDLKPGYRVDEEIQQIIRQSSIFLYLFSEFSLIKKGYQEKELAYAKQIMDSHPGELSIIPVTIEKVKEIPFIHQNILPDEVIHFDSDWGDGLTKLIQSIGDLKGRAKMDLSKSLENTRWVWPDHQSTIDYIFDFRKNGELWYINSLYWWEWNDRPIYEEQLSPADFEEPPFVIGKWEFFNDVISLTFQQFMQNIGFRGDLVATFKGKIVGDEIKGDFNEVFHAWPHEREQSLYLSTKTSVRDIIYQCRDFVFCKKDLDHYDVGLGENNPNDIKYIEHYQKMRSITFKDLSLPRAEFNRKFNLHWAEK